MVEFESLPPNSRLLLLATLELEIATEDCTNIFDLARKRHQTIHDVWRDVCKKTNLPRCTVPPRVMGVEPARKDVFVFGAEPAQASASVFTETPANGKDASPAAPVAPAASAPRDAQPSPAKNASPAAARRAAPSRHLAMAAGLGAIIVVGVGIAVFAKTRPAGNPHASSVTTITRAGETARPSRTNADAPSVPTPDGAMRRLDAINKSFSKQ